MNKSELARRAKSATPKHWHMDSQEDFAYGFEAGYRAARADLRRLLKRAEPEALSYVNLLKFPKFIRGWLRPIR